MLVECLPDYVVYKQFNASVNEGPTLNNDYPTKARIRDNHSCFMLLT